MKTDANVNAVLNDIMAGDSAGVLLYAPKEFDKEDFLGELGSRYYKCYWFNAYIHDLHQPAICLIDKILNDDPELKLRLKQLIFCGSRDNGPEIALKAALDALAKSNRDTVIIFEKMDLLPDDYDFSQYVYLIKHAPKNVKIICSSDKFLSMDISSFEPFCPMIIDENSLLRCNDICPLENYVEGIEPQDLAFLRFVSSYGIISDKMAESIREGSSALLDMLARRGIYVSARNLGGRKHYCFKRELNDFLNAKRESFREYGGEYTGEVTASIFESLYSGGLYFEALNVASVDRNYANVERAAKCILDVNSVSDASDYVVAHREFDFASEVDAAEYPYTSLLYSAYLAKHGKKYEECLERLPLIEEAMSKSPRDYAGYMCAIYVELICYIRLGQKQPFEARLAELGSSFTASEEKMREWAILRVALPEYVKFNDVGIEELESLLLLDNADKQFWYFKLLEEIECFYYKAGNYGQAMSAARRIKALCPWYVVPLRIVAMNYFEGDVSETSDLVKETLEYAEGSDRFEDMHLVYTTRALLDQYYGNGDQAKVNSDKAYSLIEGEAASFESFFTVAVRCRIKAMNGEFSYAKNLAQIYLKYARERAPKCVEMMLQCFAYVLYKCGETDRAYRYAKQAISRAERKSFVWLYSMGLATNFLLVKHELKDAAGIISNLLRYSENFGMKMAMVESSGDVFEPILKYAREHRLEPNIMQKVDSIIAFKNGGKEVRSIKVTLFGKTSVSVGGVELQWKTRKSKELFLHYVISGDVGIDRNVIIDLMWSGYLYDSAINNLKTTNNIIRKTLTANNVDFSLDYFNSRYVIKINNITSDWETYKELVAKYAQENDLSRKVAIMSQIVKLYKGDFAVDMHFDEFDHERTSIKQEMVLNLMKLIRALAREKKYMEAKEFLSALVIIDKKNDYKHMVEELDRLINIT